MPKANNAPSRPGMLRAGALLMLCLVMPGCAAIIDLPYYREYQGESLPGESVGYVTHEDPYSQSIFVRSVDGVETYWILGAMELKPGSHSITCSYCKPVHSEIHGSAQPVTFPVNVEAGRTYAMAVEEYADQEGRKWRLRVRDITDFAGTGKYKAAFGEIENYKRKVREGRALSAVRANTTEPGPLR